MQITLEADYAIRIVVFLIKNDKRVDAKNIAKGTGVTLRFALKILRKLVANKLVVSYKGAQGGYEIAKRPDTITLRSVIESVDCRFVINRCLESGATCSNPEKSCCKAKSLFAEISSEITTKLDGITLSDLV